MDLVVDQVGELQDVHVANGDRVVVRVAGAPVVQRGLAIDADEAVAVDTLGVEVAENALDGGVLAGGLVFVPVGAIEHRGGDVHRRVGVGTGLGLSTADGCRTDSLVVLLVVPAPPCGVAEVRFEHLTHVHT